MSKPPQKVLRLSQRARIIMRTISAIAKITQTQVVENALEGYARSAHCTEAVNAREQAEVEAARAKFVQDSAFNSPVTASRR